MKLKRWQPKLESREGLYDFIKGFSVKMVVADDGEYYEKSEIDPLLIELARFQANSLIDNNSTDDLAAHEAIEHHTKRPH